MNVSSWLEEAAKSVDQLDAELILAHVVAKERIFLHAHPDFELQPNQIERADQSLARRANGEPLAYITGVKDFYGRQFAVSKDVLIPRPETEALIEIAKRINPANILDVGTGSGCIAITLAKELPNAKIVAVDISEKALKVAQKNAEQHHAEVAFLQSDLLKNLPDTAKFNLIVANLPYVDKNWAWLGPELAFEPELALYAEDGGLQQIKNLIYQSPAHLLSGGYLILEADRSQHQKIIDFAIETGLFAPAEPMMDAEKSALALVLQLRPPHH